MLKVRKWVPTDTLLGGRPISFEVKRLNFLEAKPYQLQFSRIRFDLIGGELEKMARERQAQSQALISKLEAVAADAGLSVTFRTAGADQDPVDLKLEDLSLALKAGGVVVAPSTAEEIDAQITDVERTVNDRSAKLEEFYASLADGFITNSFRHYVRNVVGVEDEESGAAVSTGLDLLDFADEELVVFVLTRIFLASKLRTEEKNDSSSLSTSAPAEATTDGTSIVEPVLNEAGTKSATAPATELVGT